MRRISRRDFIHRLSLLGLAAPIFDAKLPRGLDFKHLNSPTRQKYLIETMGGGVALFDYNNYGLIDIFLVNSGRLADPVRGPELFARQESQYCNRLYRQNPDGSLTDVMEA